MTATIVIPQLTVAGAPVGKDADVDSGACWAGMFDSPDASNQYPFVQIYNPAGSGKRIYVDRAIARCIPQEETGLIWNNSPIGNLKTNILPYNLKNGSQAGYIAQIYTGTSTNQVLYPFVDLQEDDASNSFRAFEQPYPIILDPGSGLVIMAYSAGTQLLGGFYWREY
jgi:hypothetical protein